MKRNSRIASLLAVIAAVSMTAACSSSSNGSAGTSPTTTPAATASSQTVAPSPTTASAGTTPDSPSASPTATAGAKYTINIAVASKLAGHWPLWAGIEQGIFTNAGLTVNVSTVQTDTAGVQALSSGSVDFIIGTIPQIVQANKAGGDLMGVAAVQNRPIYRIIAGKNIKAASDLKGKKVGVSEVSLGIDSFLMQAWMAAQGFQKADYTLVGAGGVSTRVAALTSGGVDVTAVPPPGDTPVIAQGYTDLGFATDKIDHLQWTLLVTTKKNLASKQDAVKAFLAAYVQAIDFVKNPANKDAAVKALADQTGSTQEAALAAYPLMIEQGGISQDGHPDDAGIAAWEKLLGVQDLAAQVFTADYLPTS